LSSDSHDVMAVGVQFQRRWLGTRLGRHAFALAITAVFLIIRGVLDPLLGHYVPYLAVLPAVIICAWFCGLGPSLLSMLLAFLGEQYWFVPPLHSLAIVGTEETAGIIVYFLVSLTIIVFAEINRRTMAKLAVSTQKLQQTSAELSKSHAQLEQRVAERTRELSSKNAELAHQAEVVRELSGRLLQMQDEERRRIARELHDSVGQIVAALGMNLSTLKTEDDLSPKALQAIAENTALVQELSRQIRTVSHLLHPPLLDEVGLASALQWYVEGFAERSKIKVTLELPEKLDRLSRDLETAIFRIVQECLTNVHRHSGSPTAAVKIENVSDQVRVEVRDAGRGIHPEKVCEMASAGKTGVGVRGMRERLRQFGGTLELKSENGSTSVIATVPVPRTRAKAAAPTQESS